MKKSVQFPAAITLAFLSVLAITSCFDSIPDEYEDYFAYTPNVAKPGGNTVSLLEGNIELLIPEGAVNSEIFLSAKECDHSEQCRFLLKMVRIEPKITFAKPVTVTLKYDGILSSTDVQFTDCKPVICYWKNEEDYLNGVKQTCICCCKDTASAAIKFCVQQTGIFAVGNNGNGEFD